MLTTVLCFRVSVLFFFLSPEAPFLTSRGRSSDVPRTRLRSPDDQGSFSRRPKPLLVRGSWYSVRVFFDVSVFVRYKMLIYSIFVTAARNSAFGVLPVCPLLFSLALLCGCCPTCVLSGCCLLICRKNLYTCPYSSDVCFSARRSNFLVFAFLFRK